MKPVLKYAVAAIILASLVAQTPGVYPRTCGADDGDCATLAVYYPSEGFTEWEITCRDGSQTYGAMAGNHLAGLCGY
jgi:hypothetical protein